MNFQSTRFGSPRILTGVVAVVAVAIALCPLSAAAQDPQYDVLPLPDEYNIPNKLDYDMTDRDTMRKVNAEISAKSRKIREIRGKVDSALKGSGTISAQEFNDFFTNAFFANMTQTEPRKVGEYAKLRNDFFRFFMKNASGSLRDQLVNLTFTTMSGVATGNYHPAARVNAILMIGNLDSRRGRKESGSLVAPIPHEPSLDFLLGLLENSDTPDYLKIAAMVGVQRHAMIRPLGSSNPLSSGLRSRISGVLADLMAPVAADADARTRDGKYWLRRRAVQTIGNLRDPGDNGQNARELKNIIVSDAEPIWLRIDAMKSFQQLTFADPAQADVLAVAKAIGNLVANSARADAAYVDESIRGIKEVALFLDEEDPLDSSANADDEERQSVGMAGMFGGGEDNRRNKANDDGRELLPVYRRQLVRQRIKTIVHIASETLSRNDGNEGLIAVAKQTGNSQEAEQLITDLQQQLDTLMKTTDVVDLRRRRKNDEADDDDRSRAEKLKDALTAAAEAIEQLIKEEEPADTTDTTDTTAPTQTSSDSSTSTPDGSSGSPTSGQN